MRISGVTADTHIWIPLALGNHVDHQLVRIAAQKTELPGKRGYYEDYPYAEDAAAMQCITLPSSDLAARAMPVTAQDLDAKLAAISAYESQLSSFWVDGADMRKRVTDYAVRAGGDAPAERLWVRGIMVARAFAPSRANFKAHPGFDARLAQQRAITKLINGRATNLMPTPNPSPRANLRAGRKSSGRRWSRATAALLFCSARWLRGSGCGTGSRPAG